MSAALLERIARAGRVEEPVTLVLAHPDDETVGLGSRLAAFAGLRLVYLTDGAPRDLGDARREGYADWQAYAQARQAELESALVCLGAGAAQRIMFGLPDQAAMDDLAHVVERLVEALAGAAVVITHPYEHGHPDHDTAALAVALACAALERRGSARPVRLEFAGYHLAPGGAVFGAFWPDVAAPEVAMALDPHAIAAKRAAIACFRTQREILGAFPLSPERLRLAPQYDFTAAAPPGAAWYDGFGWGVTAARWRAQAEQALARHGGAASFEP